MGLSDGKYREYDRFIKCSKCELKAWCRGCPAVANGTNGDFYGADPQCWKIKNERTGGAIIMLMDLIKNLSYKKLSHIKNPSIGLSAGLMDFLSGYSRSSFCNFI